MTIGTYAELVSAIEDITDRDDLDTKAPMFIKLAEARLNRLLEDPEMETSVTLTGDGADLPADFGSIVSIGTADGNTLTPMGNEEYAAVLPASGTSRYYTIREGKVYYVPGSANPTLVYRRRIPALTSSNATNWLLSLAPDAYLHAVLAEAYVWDHDEERAGMHKAATDEIIGELRIDGANRKWGPGPIRPRIRRP